MEREATRELGDLAMAPIEDVDCDRWRGMVSLGDWLARDSSSRSCWMLLGEGSEVKSKKEEEGTERNG